MMKDKLFKRRNHVDWKAVLDHLEDLELNVYLWRLRSSSTLSLNRLSYLTLLHFYDKKILDYYRATGDIVIFYTGFLKRCFEN